MSALAAIAPVAARSPVPKVAMIVGPVGDITPRYRALADEAAAIAEKAGAEVVRVYSPNATWDAVEQATEGASIVVYLGHGNGWPSRYRDELYPPTQNGFGLNPVAGVDDSSHQYFGEANVEGLRLAPNAIVLLHHLCYASGNTEPGLSEGTKAQAVQRVDNYAAGFVRAGAAAVVAEGHLGPAYYLRSLLAGHRTIEQIWRGSPTYHGHELAVASERSSGFTARLDPDRSSGGYFRSLVSRGGLRAADVRASGRGVTGAPATDRPQQPTLVDQGVSFGQPALRSQPVAATPSRLLLPLSKADRAKLPKGMQVGVRWDPIRLDPVPDVPAASDAPADAATGGDASAPPVDAAVDGAADGTADAPAAARVDAAPDDAAPGADAAPPEPPQVELVVAEQLGSVVELAQVRRGAKGLVLDVQYPSAPGLYRLVPTLHTPDGAAYDQATQGLLTPLIVRVAGRVSAAFGVAPSVSIAQGATTELGVRVRNTGAEQWDATVPTPLSPLADEPEAWNRTTTIPARLVATWVSADGHPVPAAAQVNLHADSAAPGGEAVVRLALTAPAEVGDYLLLLDVVSPSLGPISAHGSEPALVRVQVTAPAESTEATPAVERHRGD